MTAMGLYLWLVGVCLLMVIGPVVAIAVAAAARPIRNALVRRRRGRYMAAYFRAHIRTGGAR